MTFPENASVDELNCDLKRDGTRARRKAIEPEEGAVLSSFPVGTADNVSFGEWKNVGEDASKTYLIVQSGDRLHFYNKDVIPFSSAEISNTVSLTPYAVGSSGGATSTRCSFASILGHLVVVSENTEPIFIEELADGSFQVTQIECKERDFKWLGEKAGYTEDVLVADITPERHYDTKNSGWIPTPDGIDPLTSYINATGYYPALTHPWFSGKNASDNFSVAEWQKVFSGSSIIGNGHYLLDVFSKSRTDVSGVSGLPVQTTNKRFKTVEAFSGRVFFSGLTSASNSGKIYFSQLLTDLFAIGDFFQQNDPTSEVSSDLLDTDGGVIVIPDAVNIRKLYAFRNSMFVFADNGVWQIKGIDDVFKPTGYSVNKVTDVGILSGDSFVAVEGVPFWWSKYGIHTMAFNEFGTASEENISIGTIQTFWDEIEPDAKVKVRAAYDFVNQKIFWIYPKNGELIQNKCNRVLILDVALQAFYPWEFSDTGNETPYVIGAQFYDNFAFSTIQENVTVGGAQVEVSSVSVTSEILERQEDNNVSVVFFYRNQSEDKMSMALTSSNTYLDWLEADYVSFAETGYDFAGDPILKKTAPYLITYMRETEEGWVTADGGASYTLTNPSSMLVSVYWDFKKSSSSSPQQAYRRKMPVVVDSTDFTSKESVVTSRLKLRGRGRSMKLRIESETGKDFVYIGHGLLADAAARF